MKKYRTAVVLPLLCLFCLLCFLTVLPAAGTEPETYPVRVCGITVTPENAADVLGDADGADATVVYTPGSPASLTLSGAVLKADTAGDDGSTAAICVDGDLRLILCGNSSVSAGNAVSGADSTGISVTGELTVTAGDKDGFLTVTAGAGNISSGICAGRLSVCGGKLHASGGTGGDASFGISVSNVRMTGGTLRAVSGSADLSIGLNIGPGGLTVEGGTLTAISGRAGEYSSTGLFSEAHITVSGGSVTGTGAYAAHYADSCGIATTFLNVSGGSVTGTGANTHISRASIGISAASAELSGGTISGTATGTSSAAAYGIHIFLSGDTVKNNGRIIVSGDADVTARCDRSTVLKAYYALYTDESEGGGLYLTGIPDITGTGEVYVPGLRSLKQSTSSAPVRIRSALPQPGDVNFDGSVDVDDVLLLARYWAGHPVMISFTAADFNGDGSVTRADAMLLSRDVVWGDAENP